MEGSGREKLPRDPHLLLMVFPDVYTHNQDIAEKGQRSICELILI